MIRRGDGDVHDLNLSLAYVLVHDWVEERCEALPRTRGRALYQDFYRWCQARGAAPESIPSDTDWGRQLTRMGYPPEDRKGRHYRALRLRAVPGAGGVPGI
jgi:hypothetical protein